MAQDDLSTILITGANTGIGAACALSMARPGRRLVLACRSEERTRPVLDGIRERGAEAEFLALDLGDLGGAERAARTFAEREQKLDLLIANAGLAGQHGLTRDGYELAFGTNHLGHFAFTLPLLPLLERGSWRDDGTGRIVVVSSGSHRQAREVPWSRLREKTASFSGMPEYAVSKLCNVIFAAELRRRTPLAVIALHPGRIASDIWRPVPSWFRGPLERLLAMEPVEAGGDALVNATEIDLRREGAPLYLHVRAPRGLNSVALRQDLGTALWDFSALAVARSGARGAA